MRVSRRHIVSTIELHIIRAVDAQVVVDALGDLEAHVVGDGTVVVVVEVGVDDDGAIRRQGGYQVRLIKRQLTVVSVPYEPS